MIQDPRTTLARVLPAVAHGYLDRVLTELAADGFVITKAGDDQSAATMFLGALTDALEAEQVPETTRRRVANRLLHGHPRGANAREQIAAGDFSSIEQALRDTDAAGNSVEPGITAPTGNG